MKRLLLLAALATNSCDLDPQEQGAPPVTPLPNENVGKPIAQSKIPLVVPKPKDQSQLDRLILAGYTPHADHLHPPGVKSCPLAEGANAVM